jgi:hypothetical protein
LQEFVTRHITLGIPFPKAKGKAESAGVITNCIPNPLDPATTGIDNELFSCVMSNITCLLTSQIVC